LWGKQHRRWRKFLLAQVILVNQNILISFNVAILYLTVRVVYNYQCQGLLHLWH
jgi:hypothetical protein